jgi:glycosyltransferase involved in cell wall biosynthesis
MMPRVVILTPFFRPIMGGVESNAERLSRYLSADGFDVTVLTKHLTRELPDEERVDGFRIRRIGPFGPRAPAAKWLMLPHVIAWLTSNRSAYDVVCSIDCRGVGLGAIAARAVTRRPVIAQPQTTGVLVPDGHGSSLVNAIKRPLGALYGRADAIACIARPIEREALSRGIPRGRVHLLPNAIDMTQFREPSAEERSEARSKLGLEPTEVVCVFVGRLSREKGLMDLMRAWKLLPIASRGMLLVAGPDMDGHAWDVGREARAFSVDQALTSSVRFLGPIDDVPSLMRVADIVIQPSHFEALGLSAIEALACGVPVVASAVGGLLDFVVDDVNGRTCPPQDPAALATALKELIENSVVRRRLASNARQSVVQDYDERVVFSRFGSLIRQLMDQP